MTVKPDNLAFFSLEHVDIHDQRELYGPVEALACPDPRIRDSYLAPHGALDRLTRTQRRLQIAKPEGPSKAQGHCP